MKYRVVEKSDGTFWPQRRVMGLWFTLTYTAGIGPSLGEYPDVRDSLDDAWRACRAHAAIHNRQRAQRVRVHQQEK